jgi:hypothetical protein
MMSEPKAYFLLVAADVERRRFSLPSAYEVALHRLRKGVWGLKERTRNRLRLRIGDRLVIYTAGNRNFGGCFVASAEVASRVQVCKSWQHAVIDSPDIRHARIVSEYFIEVASVEVFQTPTPIRALKTKLQFIKSPESPYWAASLQNGCTRISSGDFRLIRKAGSQVTSTQVSLKKQRAGELCTRVRH